MRKTTRYIIVTASLLMIALLISLFGKSSKCVKFEKTDFHSAGRDSLTAYIVDKDGIYSKKGFVMGLQYSLFSRFAETYNFKVDIVGQCGEKNIHDLLSDKGIDIIILKSQDEIPDHYSDEVMESAPVSDFKWVVRKEDEELLRKINLWLGTFSQSREYKRLANKFLRSYNLNYYIKTNTFTDRISPYDDIIKRHSKVLGWDWRLLAAVIFKESRFSLTACSPKGATGLMQVLSSTANDYGINDLFDPESNIKAGTHHLNAIKNRYENMAIDSINVLKFTLAAYNAGEGRIEDCINFTMHQGGDSMNWEAVAKTISLMRLPEYYENADYLKFGPFTGRETVSYVDDILAQYEEYLNVVK